MHIIEYVFLKSFCDFSGENYNMRCINAECERLSRVREEASAGRNTVSETIKRRILHICETLNSANGHVMKKGKFN